MAAYIGDVLSYYLDNSINELLLPYAQERSSIDNIANMFGYKFIPNSTANV